MTFILLGISFAFLLFTIPNRLMTFLWTQFIIDFISPTFCCRIVVVIIMNVNIPDVFIALTRNLCHVNFAINSIFYFYVSEECREELRKAVCGRGKQEQLQSEAHQQEHQYQAISLDMISTDITILSLYYTNNNYQWMENCKVWLIKHVKKYK